MARPMPLVPPITRATWSSRRKRFKLDPRRLGDDDEYGIAWLFASSSLQQLRRDQAGKDQRNVRPDDDRGEHEDHRDEHDERVLEREAYRDPGDRARDHEAESVGRRHQTEGERDD